ncbi:hypothetical protein, partial [Saccharomonospora saliphila]|uniref:hypothetical protein n=1 Tax=Saccharomonospora saliphila TaxID=369829 RepID=UPI00048C5E7E
MRSPNASRLLVVAANREEATRAARAVGGEVPVGDLTKQVITVAGSVPGTVSLAELDGSARV